MIERLPSNVEAMGVVAAYGSHVKNTSASRLQMLTAQLAQVPPIENSEVSRCLHGFEKQLSNHTFGGRAPCDLRMVAMIKRNINSNINPKTLLIYEVIGDGDTTFNALELNSDECNHELFGFQAKMNPDIRRQLEERRVIKKGTVLTHSSNVKENGYYGSGINVMTCYMSLQGVIEDGVIASRSLVENHSPMCYGSVAIECGADEFLLPIYSVPGKEPKLIPEIGDKIREDGVIAVLRKRDPLYDCLNLQEESMHVATEDDRMIYADDRIFGSEAYITDIEVIDSSNSGGREKQQTPPNLVKQLRRHANMATQYYDKVIETYERLRRTFPDATFGPAFVRELVRAYMDKPNDQSRRFSNNQRGKKNVILKNRGRTMKEFRIVIRYRWKLKLTELTKVTNPHAGKGVITAIWPDEWMPRDEYGRRAGAIYLGAAGTRRLNTGQFFEQHGDNHSTTVLRYMGRSLADGSMDWDGVREMMSSYLAIVSPPMKAEYDTMMPNDQINYIQGMIDADIFHMHIPADNQYVSLAQTRQLEDFMQCEYGPATYFNQSTGKYETTKDPVLFGRIYMYILEKSAPKGLSSATSKTQHHGLPAVPNPMNRSSTPVNEKPSNAYSETEKRFGGACIGPFNMEHKVDYSTNPVSAMMACRKVAEAENPARIPEIVNRGEFKDSDPAFRVGLAKGIPQLYFKSITTNVGLKFSLKRVDK